MTTTYNIADPFLLRLNPWNWDDSALIRGIRTLPDRQTGLTLAGRALALSLIVALSAAAFVLVGAVRAQDPVAPASLSIHYNDLDFSHAADAQVLLDRIKDAAVEACGGTPDLRDVRRVVVFDQCRKTAIRQAVRRIDQPIVTAIADPESLPMRLAIR